MAKCCISGQDIKPGDLIVEVSRFNQPAHAPPCKVTALKQAFNNTTVVEELRERVRQLEAELGVESKVAGAGGG